MNLQYDLENKHLNIISLSKQIEIMNKENYEKIDLLNLTKEDLDFIMRGIETIMYVNTNIKNVYEFTSEEMIELKNDIENIENAYSSEKYLNI